MNVIDSAVKSIEDNIGMLFICALAFTAWILGDKLPSYKDEADMYYVLCSDAATPKACSTKAKILEHLTYKAIPEAQAVVYWSRSGAPSKYSDCAVRNAGNWSCNDGGQTVRMSDGQYSTGPSPLPSPDANYWQVPKWQWYVFQFNTLFL